MLLRQVRLRSYNYQHKPSTEVLNYGEEQVFVGGDQITGHTVTLLSVDLKARRRTYDGSRVVRQRERELR